MDLDDRPDGLVNDQTANASTSSRQYDSTEANKPSVINRNDSSGESTPLNASHTSPPLDDNGIIYFLVFYF